MCVRVIDRSVVVVASSVPFDTVAVTSFASPSTWCHPKNPAIPLAMSLLRVRVPVGVSVTVSPTVAVSVSVALSEMEKFCSPSGVVHLYTRSVESAWAGRLTAMPANPSPVTSAAPADRRAVRRLAM